MYSVQLDYDFVSELYDWGLFGFIFYCGTIFNTEFQYCLLYWNGSESLWCKCTRILDNSLEISILHRPNIKHYLVKEKGYLLRGFQQIRTEFNLLMP